MNITNESNVTDDWRATEYAHEAGDILREPHNIVCLVLGLGSIAFNVTSLCVMSFVRDRRKAHFQFITSLAVADLLITVSAMLHTLGQVLLDSSTSSRLLTACVAEVLRASNNTGLNSSLLNLLGMAVDHYLAILKPLHHHSMLSPTRSSLIIGAFWLLALALGCSDLVAEPTSIPRIQRMYNMNYCEAVWTTRYQAEYCTFALALVTCLVMVGIYSRICAHIRHRHALRKSSSAMTWPMMYQAANNNDTRNGCRRATNYGRPNKQQVRQTRAVVTTLLILGTFLVCWAPTVVYEVVMVVRQTSDHRIDWTLLQNVHKYMFLLLLLNCVADPLIYSLRLPEMRRAYRRLLRQRCRRRGGSSQPITPSVANFSTHNRSVTSSLRLADMSIVAGGDDDVSEETTFQI